MAIAAQAFKPEKVDLSAPASVKAKAPLGGYVAGVLTAQVVNNALHLSQPLIIAELSGSLAVAAFVASAETGVHMLGTLLSGGPADRLGPRRLLILATALRAAALALVPLAWAFGGLTLAWALTAYTLDAFVRGFIDTAVHSLPLGLADGDRSELDRLNSSYEFAFDLGSVVGPLLLGFLMLASKGFIAHAVIPIGFAAAAALFRTIPAERVAAVVRRDKGKAPWADFSGWKRVAGDPRLLAPCLGLAVFNLFPLRKVWSAFFAKGVLGQPAAVGWLGAAFGLGGVLGAGVYQWNRSRVSASAWVAAGACGTTALALGWIPGSLWPMLAAAAAFGLGNACAELSLLRRLQESTPVELGGRVTAVARVGASSASVFLKMLMAGAFAMGAAPQGAFAIVGAGLGVIVLIQLAVACRLAAADQAAQPAPEVLKPEPVAA